MELNSGTVLFLVYVIWNFATFALMGVDKHKAKRGLFRIPEQTLIGCAFLMGGVGSILGAVVFHHKVRKWKFRVLLPVALLFNAVLLYGALYLH